MHVNNIINYAQSINWNSPLNRGLISWWMVLPRWRGGLTWRDLCNRNHGTLTNMDPATDWVAGSQTGGRGSLAFNSGGTEYVETTLADALGDFTIVAWFLNDGGATAFERICDKNFSSGTWLGRNDTTANQWGGGVRESGPPYGRYITLTDGVWHQIASVRSGTNHSVIGDGGAVSTSGTVSSTALSTDVFRIGRQLSGASGQLGGYVSSVRVYSIAKSASDIRALYLDDLAGNPQTLNRIRRTTSYFLPQLQNNIYIPPRKLIKTNTLIGVGSQFIG